MLIERQRETQALVSRGSTEVERIQGRGLERGWARRSRCSGATGRLACQLACGTISRRTLADICGAGDAVLPCSPASPVLPCVPLHNYIPRVTVSLYPCIPHVPLGLPPSPCMTCMASPSRRVRPAGVGRRGQPAAELPAAGRPAARQPGAPLSDAAAGR